MENFPVHQSNHVTFLWPAVIVLTGISIIFSDAINKKQMICASSWFFEICVPNQSENSSWLSFINLSTVFCVFKKFGLIPEPISGLDLLILFQGVVCSVD